MDNLLKVMFVDDEHLVRSLLRNCLDWHAIGYEVVGEAANAPEALEMVEMLQPDVIFTDINMPYMDGLEFGRLVYERHASVKIIVLTGYEEFEYAKRGIKIGISDFLLKPVNDDEIRKVAVDIREKILKERDFTAEYARIRKQLEDNLPFLREKTLNELVQSTLEPEELLGRARYFRILLDERHVQVAVMEALPAQSGDMTGEGTGDGIGGGIGIGDGGGDGEEARLLLRMQCRELTERFFRDDGRVHVFFDNNQYVVILSSDPDVGLDDCIASVHAMLVNKLQCCVCVGIGKAYDSIARARSSYREAVQALHYKLVVGNNAIIGYDDINPISRDASAPNGEPLEELGFYLKVGLRDKVLGLIGHAFSEAGTAGVPRIDAFRALAASALSIIVNVAADTGANLPDVLPGNAHPFDRIFGMSTLPDIRRYVEETAERTLQVLAGMQSRKVSQVIGQVREYIRENLADPELSLARTAKVHFVNMSYLSRIFKQETGQNFVEHLTTLRMEKAVRLLRETDMKAYEVAEAVGIVNQHYFGICFKKWTGMSVSDFRRQSTSDR